MRDIQRDLARLHNWAYRAPANEVLAEFERRGALLRGLRGTEWIVHSRAREILEAVCVGRWGHLADQLRAAGVVVSTLTDCTGVVHDWRSREDREHSYWTARSPAPDRPTKIINCVHCIARYPW